MSLQELTPMKSPTLTDSPTPTKIEEKKDRVSLKQTLGLHHGVTMIMGGIIGSGIFVSPKGVVQEMGSVGGALVVWTLCGLVSCIGAMCYAELGTCILKSGADYAYIREAFGKLPGFLYLWVSLVVINSTGNAITSLTFAYYILQPFFPNCEPPALAVRLIAALAILLLTFINCINVSWVVRLQNVFTVLKLAALAIIIFFGLFYIFTGHTVNLQEPFAATTTNPGAYALAFYSGLFSYSGWNYLNFVTEEIKNPYKNLPRAIWISIPLITIIYLLTNLSYFTILTLPQLLNSNAVAVSFGDICLGYFSWSMPLFVAASTFGALNCCLFALSRLVFVGAREGVLPSFVALINVKFLTPMTALLFSSVVSLMMLVSNDVYLLINYTSFVETLVTAVSILSLLRLRWTRPKMHRPIKVHLSLPIIYLSVSVFLLGLPLFYTPIQCLFAIAMVLSGIPVYGLCVAWTNKPKVFLNFIEKTNIFCQKLFMSMPPDEKEE